MFVCFVFVLVKDERGAHAGCKVGFERDRGLPQKTLGTSVVSEWRLVVINHEFFFLHGCKWFQVSAQELEICLHGCSHFDNTIVFAMVINHEYFSTDTSGFRCLPKN